MNMRGRPEGTYELSDKEIVKIIDMLKEGKYVAEIARKVGCNKSTVYNYAKRFDIDL